ncbi:hypothetical protein CBR_g21959 [Chara braunii]|uniref:Uncharacterized protein n=1 Tax=Chara braunii TaxID=69332 RepID=A0A388L1M3_CHABU|nr:hypothetical protein CBR_g21959 [Chara braunii]|eukprot:GBG76210.1 hypothetical protein CBR_g21959 [Chara braunii]
MEDSRQHLQHMVSLLSVSTPPPPAVIGGAIEGAKWVENVIQTMLEVIWVLEEGPIPELDEFVDWRQVEALSSDCYTLLDEGLERGADWAKRSGGELPITTGMEGVILNSCASGSDNNDNNNNNNTDGVAAAAAAVFVAAAEVQFPMVDDPRGRSVFAAADVGAPAAVAAASSESVAAAGAAVTVAGSAAAAGGGADVAGEVVGAFELHQLLLLCQLAPFPLRRKLQLRTPVVLPLLFQ